MPKTCDDCQVSADCPNDEHIDGYIMQERPRFCQLYSVSKHGDLIDKRGVDVLSWTEKDEGDFKDGVLFVLDKLDELPVIIPADPAEEGE